MDNEEKQVTPASARRIRGKAQTLYLVWGLIGLTCLMILHYDTSFKFRGQKLERFQLHSDGIKQIIAGDYVWINHPSHIGKFGLDCSGTVLIDGAAKKVIEKTITENGKCYFKVKFVHAGHRILCAFNKSGKLQSDVFSLEVLSKTLSDPHSSFVEFEDSEAGNIDHHLSTKNASRIVQATPSLKFLIHMRDEYGNRVRQSPGSFDYLAVYARGPLTTFSYTTQLNESTHTFNVNVSMAGDYIITVKLLQSEFRFATSKSELCFNPDTEESDVEVIKVRSVSRITQKEFDFQPRICTKHDDLSRGGYIPIKYSLFSPWMEQTRPDDKSIWRPHTCQLKVYTTKEIEKLLTGKWIAFTGDSTTKELAVFLIKLLGWKMDNLWLDERFQAGGDYRKRIFDTSRKIVNGQNDDIRVSMLWASNVDPHENFMGLKVFDDNTYLQMWKNWHSNSTSGKKRPDVIVFNSGIHDLADPEFTFEAYANRLPKVLDLMERSADLVIWKTLNPKYHEFNCNFWSKKDHTGEAGIKALNDLSLKIVRQRKNIIIMDESALLKGVPEDVDSHHCEFRRACYDTMQILISLIS